METNTESSFLFPCSSGWLEAGAGVRAALTMGDGVERGREGAEYAAAGRDTHIAGATQGREISPYISPILQSWNILYCISCDYCRYSH